MTSFVFCPGSETKVAESDMQPKSVVQDSSPALRAMHPVADLTEIEPVR